MFMISEYFSWLTYVYIFVGFSFVLHIWFCFIVFSISQSFIFSSFTCYPEWGVWNTQWKIKWKKPTSTRYTNKKRKMGKLWTTVKTRNVITIKVRVGSRVKDETLERKKHLRISPKYKHGQVMNTNIQKGKKMWSSWAKLGLREKRWRNETLGGKPQWNTNTIKQTSHTKNWQKGKRWLWTHVSSLVPSITPFTFIFYSTITLTFTLSTSIFSLRPPLHPLPLYLLDSTFMIFQHSPYKVRYHNTVWVYPSKTTKKLRKIVKVKDFIHYNEIFQKL